MGSNASHSEEVKVSRSVEIQVSNNTKNIVLKEPRTFLFNGHRLWTPESSVPPGSSTTCKFQSHTCRYGCKGLLAFQAKPFTLAIYFSNPIDYDEFSPEMGLELSLDKVHMGYLEAAYHRLVRISRCSSSNEDLAFPSVILKESQETARLNAGPVKVTATMSQGQDTVIKVKMEEQGSSTAAYDYDWFHPEMDLELFLDKLHKKGPDAAYQGLLRMARGDNFPSMVLREYQELAKMSAGPVMLSAAIFRAWDAVIKVKVEEQKSLGRELKARALHF
ncbi:uncharacterized protein LOC134565437 [Prinia subflava]|uniref:uncharacterized protein LOC134565437 n=1 Tax=Prinia subflava TaxID=208062 RepID=UPI002FE29225